jgi:hypothetical protein
MSTSNYGCHNRQPLQKVRRVQTGWGWPDENGRVMHWIDDTMSKTCEFTKTDLGKVDPRCTGCKHRIDSAEKQEK